VKTTDWLPTAIGLGVGLGEGTLQETVLKTSTVSTRNLVLALYRAGIFGFGLVRELTAGPGESPVKMDIDYGMMTAAVALEGIELGAVLNGAPASSLGMVAHPAGCSTCASRKPVVAAPLLTPAASLAGYPAH
jgi:hypothetical protein